MLLTEAREESERAIARHGHEKVRSDDKVLSYQTLSLPLTSLSLTSLPLTSLPLTSLSLHSLLTLVFNVVLISVD